MPENSDLNDVAMGRVFTGKRAKDDISIPLVDIKGGMHDAIDLAKSAAGLTKEDEIEIVEYPKPPDSFSDFFDKSETHVKVTDILKGILPAELLEQLEILDILPIIIDDELQMIIPYKIEVK